MIEVPKKQQNKKKKEKAAEENESRTGQQRLPSRACMLCVFTLLCFYTSSDELFHFDWRLPLER